MDYLHTYIIKIICKYLYKPIIKSYCPMKMLFAYISDILVLFFENNTKSCIESVSIPINLHSFIHLLFTCTYFYFFWLKIHLYIFKSIIRCISMNHIIQFLGYFRWVLHILTYCNKSSIIIWRTSCPFNSKFP